MVLGAYQDAQFESRSIVVDPGDTVLLYTDGVTEARSEDGRLFGDDRLRNVAAAAAAGGGSAQ